LLNFDQNVLIRIVGELRKSVQRLSALAGIMEDRFVADADKVASAKYHLRGIHLTQATPKCCVVLQRSGDTTMGRSS